MLARLGFWKEIKEPTRFDKHSELRRFQANIDELRAKAQALEQEATPASASTIVRAKHLLLKTLTTKIDDLIRDFNQKEGGEYDPADETLDAIQLTQECFELVDGMLHGDAKRLLLVQRSHHSETAQAATSVTALTGIVVAGSALSLPLIVTFFGALLLTKPISGTVQDAVGIRTETTASVSLLERLRAALQTASLNLQLLLKDIQKMQERERKLNAEFLDIDTYAPQVSLPKADPTICPITLVRMTDPVLCTLDDTTYERNAITNWLVEHRSAPITRKRIGMNISVDDVLKPNRALKDIIEHRVEMENSLRKSVGPK